jgi:hypothetical protein
MAPSTREPLLNYLLIHAGMLRRSGTPRAAEDQLAEHARALEMLADFVRGLAEDDERLLTLSSLAVRAGQFAPGPGTEHALTQFSGHSLQECDAFLSLLSRIARDDAIANARQRGYLPPQRPV